LTQAVGREFRLDSVGRWIRFRRAPEQLPRRRNLRQFRHRRGQFSKARPEERGADELRERQRKSALFELKGFLPDIFPSHLQHLQGSGETGLAGEAKRRDFKAIYHPEALVYHHVQRERMTYRYFEKRFYFAGIDGSYSSIRATYTFRKIDMVSHVVKKHLKLLRTGYFYIKIRSYPAKRAALCRRFWRAEQKGRKFHQDAVRQHPDILDWIQKSDYWDCGEMVQRLTYPDLYK